ncbi:signal peptidase I [Sphingomonas paucimobilis]|uniref:Signal peptidase I n=3 Tax=Bacteria TaxID=2 RepID=A0A0C9N7M3_SPHPI|nr:signal peptidase I [Sphingomonas paucimobilis]BCI70752.1 signal peptidase I [Sphingomonas paucimobilis]GAN12107.1 putative signal peptidase I [Sphingomonas paucimobilis NBRC 13935]CQD07200.1 signal peptidase I LepB [Mycobacterium europaeum]SUJ25884.1 Signal peptidase I [Sphingomonas paucimobilis]
MTPRAGCANPLTMADTPQKSEAKDTLRFFLKLALFVFILRSFIVTSFVIPSESMLPRLLIGDYLFVTKWNYGYSRWSFPFGLPLLPGRILGRDPARGDVVVFRSPGPDDHDVIKRVIGLPGDTIQVQNGQVILNGRPVPKQRVADFILPLTPNFPAEKCGAEHLDTVAGKAVCRYARFRETLPNGKSYDVLDQGDFPDRDDTVVYTVPAGDVFLMGDNRDDSADSRFAPPMGMGYIPMNRLEGRAAVTFFSTDGSAEWIKPWTWVSAARWNRIGEGF